MKVAMIVFCIINLKITQKYYVKGVSAEEFVPSVIGVRSGNKSCTGFIIHESWAITAAHCIENENFITAFAGSEDPLGPDAVALECEAVIHPEFNNEIAELGGNDIALIKFEQPLSLNENISIIKLSEQIWPTDEEEYRLRCLFLGYESWEPSPIFHVRRVFAEHGYKACGGCTVRYQQDRLVCLKRDDTAGICGDNYGGPLICKRAAVALAHKIYKWTDCQNDDIVNDAVCHSKETVSAFLYLRPYLGWIKQYVRPEPFRTGYNLHRRSKSISVTPDLLLIVSLLVTNLID